jgi:hypothetical protein
MWGTGNGTLDVLQALLLVLIVGQLVVKFYDVPHAAEWYRHLDFAIWTTAGVILVLAAVLGVWETVAWMVVFIVLCAVFTLVMGRL